MSLEFNFGDEIIKNRNKWLSMAKYYYPRDIQSAEDLVSETIEKILKNKDKFEIGTNFNAWGYNILRNTFINQFRSSKRNGVDFELDSERCINLVSIDADVDVRESDILAYIDKLPNDLKNAFNQHLLGFKYEEIADKFGVPIGTIKSRIHLARHTLQKRLTMEFDKTKTIIKSTEIMPIPVDKTENLKALFKYLYEFCDNEWKSVKIYPLTPIYIKYGLDHNWGSAIMQTLCDCREFSITGDKAGIKYSSNTSIKPDFNILAIKTIKNRKEQQQDAKERLLDKRSLADEPRKYIRKTDTVNSQLNYSKPIVIPKEKFMDSVVTVNAIIKDPKIPEVITTQINKSDNKIEFHDERHMESVKNLLFKTPILNQDIIPKLYLNPDDSCYVIHEGKILEMEIVGINKFDGVYLHNLYNSQYKIEIFKKPLSELYDSPEALCNSLLENFKNR